MHDLWHDQTLTTWQSTLDRYADIVAAQQVSRLMELDRWYRDELPSIIAARDPQCVTLDELGRTTEWKMKRGVWRQRNLILVRSNDPKTVEGASKDALARVPDPRAPISVLAKLAGVGPATASAILSAVAPDIYPFFDELVASQVPGLGKVDFTARYYAAYADALRERAAQLGNGWSPTMVERALWANAGGKAAAVGAKAAGRKIE